MAANLSAHDPISVVSTRDGNCEAIQNYLEAASQTFPGGVFVSLSSGNATAWSGSNPGTTPAVVGVAFTAGQNLGAAGAGAPPQFGNYGFPGGPTYGSVPNQPSAVNIFNGAIFFTGETLVAQAVPNTIFRIQVDASSGGTYNATTALIGTQLGVTIDSGGTQYADLAKSTAGTNTLVVVVGLDPNDLTTGSTTTQVNNGHIYVTVLNTLSQATT